MPEGLLVWTYNNPSVSRADSSLCTREPVLGEALYADSGRGGSLPSLCKRRWHTECTEGLLVWTYNNPSVSRVDSSLCTREPVLGEALYADSGRGGSLPSLCKGRWRTKCVGRVVIYKNRRLLQNTVRYSAYPAVFCHFHAGKGVSNLFHLLLQRTENIGVKKSDKGNAEPVA